MSSRKENKSTADIQAQEKREKEQNGKKEQKEQGEKKEQNGQPKQKEPERATIRRRNATDERE